MLKEIEAKVRNILKENMKTSADIDKIDAAQSLTDIGFNSVDFIKVAVGIEAEFEFEFSDEDLNFDLFDSIEKITAFVQQKKSLSD